MWQTIALYAFGAAVCVGVVIAAFRMLRREARRGARDREKVERHEVEDELEREADAASGVVPLSRGAQLKWLRYLQGRARRRQSEALPPDDGRGDR